MELLTFKLIIDIGIGLCNLTKGVFSSDRKKKLGAWMVELGDLIAEVADSLENKRYPHTTCAKMQYMVGEFETVVGTAMEESDVKELAIMLHQAQNIERLFSELSLLDDREIEVHLARLRETAGTLQAAGGILEKGL